MKLISWNVNGVRAVLKKGFADFVAAEKPDIVCLQETKATPEEVTVPAELAKYTAYWNAAEKKGYSGTALFTRKKPLQVTTGINIADHDREGRVLTAEYQDFFLVNVYVPNSKRELTRLAYRQQWDRDFLAYLKGLEARSRSSGTAISTSRYRDRSRAALRVGERGVRRQRRNAHRVGAKPRESRAAARGSAGLAAAG